jgi:serine/threonine-protein kinase
MIHQKDDGRVGQTIAHYKILEKLGEGGMGVVYKAQDTKLERLVALKFLPSHLNASEQDKARFIQEAKAAAALNHPNVCSVIAIQEHDTQMFIVMEFVDGQTLREKRGTMSFKQAIEIGIQVADGLAAAHEKGITHRDVKPENIMIRKDGIAQIMDFGLAKLRGASRLTKEGSTVGTAGYMSPEQVQGLEIDHRTDIFSLGVILYELFAGQSPFKSAHEAAINYEIVNEDPQPISALKPDIDVELEAIVFDCLAKDPTERFQSAAELARNLRRFKKPSSRTRMSRSHAVQSSGNTKESDRDSLTRPKRQWLLVAAALLVGVLIGIGIMRWGMPGEGSSSPSQASRIRASINLPAEAPLILDFDLPTIGFNSPVIAISPQGTWLSYVAKTTSGQMLHLIDMSNGQAQPLRGTEGAVHPFFSPDGEWIGFLTQDRVKKVLRRGGTVISLCEATTPVLAWWTRSGTIYFTERQNSALSRVSIDGTGKENLISNKGYSLQGTLLPGETHILAVKKNGISDDYGEIILVDLQTHEAKTLVRSGYAPRYIPPGYILFAHASSLMAVRFDVTTKEVVGEPVTVAAGATMESLFGILQATSSNTGILAFVPGSDISVGKPAWVNLRGDVEYLDMQERVYGVVDLAPNDNRLAVHVADVKDYVWIWDNRRQEGRRIPSQIAEGWPRWSYSGRKLVSTATRTEGPGIFVRDVTQEGAISNLLKLEINASAAGWSPDDEVLTASIRGQEKSRVGFVGLYKQVDIPGFDGAFPVISPDARLVAYRSVQTGQEEVFLRSYPEGRVLGQVSTRGGTEPLWMPSGELFYRNGRRWFSTHVTSFPEPSWDPPHLVFDTDFIDTPGWSYDVSRDGQRFVVVKRIKPIISSRIDILTNWFEVFND